jgi:hypothetical protein
MKRKRTAMTCKASPFGTALLSCLFVLNLSGPALRAEERIEYEGELRFGSAGGPEPPPQVRVVTVDGKVRQVTTRFSADNGEMRVEQFEFAGDKPRVVRYKELSAKTGEVKLSHDLTKTGRDDTTSPAERERITKTGEVLVRHFYLKGSYRKVASGER